jgi:hypothetical protein
LQLFWHLCGFQKMTQFSDSRRTVVSFADEGKSPITTIMRLGKARERPQAFPQQKRLLLTSSACLH